jgi:hypothetical protein
MNTDEDQQGTYAKVNGLDLYFEIHGSGQPLVLLPGGFMTIEAMGELVPQRDASSASSCKVMGIPPISSVHSASNQWLMISPP